MTDIIGTPVERVIPEGWSVLRDADVKVDDAIGGYKKWERVGSCVSTIPTIHTDGDGWVKLGVDHYLVIRRNAPEPSVEKLRRERDDWKALTELQEVTVANLKAKVAELELNLAGRRQYVQELEERNARQYKLLGERGAEAAPLKAKVAELETKVAAHAETIRWWKLHADECAARINAKDSEIKALRPDRDHYKKLHGELTTKLNAVKKAWEGA